jgi:hypothetical protein
MQPAAGAASSGRAPHIPPRTPQGRYSWAPRFKTPRVGRDSADVIDSSATEPQVATTRSHSNTAGLRHGGHGVSRERYQCDRAWIRAATRAQNAARKRMWTLRGVTTLDGNGGVGRGRRGLVRADRSVRTFPGNHCPASLAENVQVKPERPVTDIVHVVSFLLFDIRDSARRDLP